MKFIALILFALLGAIIAVNGSIDHNGQPGCKTDVEIQVQKYRNNWDPTRYWLCSTIGVAATSVRCPDQYAFLTSANGCVVWQEWAWVNPVEPPSRPN